MKRLKQYFEYERINFTKEGFSEAEILALESFSDQASFYNLAYGGLRFKEFVGVLQVGDLTIEVLPKVDRADEEKGKWRNILLDMLKECRLLQPEATGFADLRLRANSILDLYFELFLAETESLLHRGLIKKYRTEFGNQYALKGRLLFNEHIANNLIHAERFYTEHTTYDQKHLLHQVLRQALEVIARIAAGTSTGIKAQRTLSQWPEGETVPITDQLFNRFPLTRKSQHYQNALHIAKLILLNFHPDLRNGRTNVLALMFDMNALWEKFIYSRIKSCAAEFGWRVSDQCEYHYWKGESGRKKLIPDILIEMPDGGRVIVDTKWKCPVDLKPDDQDLRQLLAYKIYFKSDRAFLLYPCYEQKSFTVQGLYQERTHQNIDYAFRTGIQLHGGLLFFNLLSEGKLISRKLFSESIVEFIS